MRFSGFLPEWYIAVAVAMGDGRNACTWSARKPFFFSHRASSRMSSSVAPGGAARGEDARWPGTGLFGQAALAPDPLHVGCRAARLGNHAGEPGEVVQNRLNLANKGLLGAALDDAAFVFGNGAEGAPAEATPL